MPHGKAKNPSSDKRKKRRLYLTYDEIQTLFAAAWKATEYVPKEHDANSLIVEYIMKVAKKEIED